MGGVYNRLNYFQNYHYMSWNIISIYMREHISPAPSQTTFVIGPVTGIYGRPPPLRTSPTLKPCPTQVDPTS